LLIEHLPEGSACKLQAVVDLALAAHEAVKVQQHIAAYTAVAVVVEGGELEHY